MNIYLKYLQFGILLLSILILLVIPYFLVYNNKKSNQKKKYTSVALKKENRPLVGSKLRNQYNCFNKENTNQKVQRMCQKFLYDPENNWTTLLECADIYRTGAYPHYINNNYIAQELFQAVSMSSEPYIAGIAQEKCIELQDTPICDDDIHYNAQILQCPYLENIKMTAMLNANKGSIINPKHKNHEDAQECNVENNQRDTDTYNEQQRADNRRQNKRTEDPCRETLEIQIANDTQNVHDSVISSYIQSNINTINRSKNNEITHDEIQKDIENVIDSINKHNDINENTKLYAKRVINELTDNIHSKYQLSEKQVLSLIYKRIINNENKENAIEILANQLVDCIEDKHVVCSSGRIAHIVQTLECLDSSNEDLQIIKPKFALREEISNIASKIQQKWKNNEKYLNDDKEIMERVKSEFKNEVYDKYKDLHLNKNYLDSLINEYKNEL